MGRGKYSERADRGQADVAFRRAFICAAFGIAWMWRVYGDKWRNKHGDILYIYQSVGKCIRILTEYAEYLRFFPAVQRICGEIGGKNMYQYAVYLDDISFSYEKHVVIKNLSIRDNITCGHSISDEIVWAACKNASLTKWIESLPDGLDTNVGERGNQVSGGQAQRIQIARALCKDASVILLDEPVSALDQDTGQSVLDALGRYDPDELAGTVPEGIVVCPALRHRFIIVLFEGGVVLHDIVCCVHECVPEHSGATLGHPLCAWRCNCQTDRQKGPDRQRQAAYWGWRSGVCHRFPQVSFRR